MKKYVALLGLLVLITIPAMADSLYFAGVGGATGTVNGTTYYVYPYNIGVNGGTPFGMTCDTFFGHANVGDTWNADLHKIGDAGTMFADPNAYIAAAWLLNQYHGGNAADINIAIWGLFSAVDFTGNDAAKSLHDAALAFAAGGNTTLQAALKNNLRIYTPLDANGGVDFARQEMLYLTPEPGTLILFGSGLLSAVGVLRRRFHV